MADLDRKAKWMAAMVEKYGSEEAVREEMQRRQQKSRQTYKGKGGFAYLKEHDPEKLKNIRWHKEKIK